MLLQVVLAIVAPFGITRIASAVANCSDGPWAVARLPPARAMDPRRRLAINSAAFRIVRAGRGASPFGLHRTLPGDSRPVFNSLRAQQLVPFNSHPGTSVGVAALVQRWLRWLDSVEGLEVATTTMRAEREDVATPMRHRSCLLYTSDAADDP